MTWEERYAVCCSQVEAKLRTDFARVREHDLTPVLERTEGALRALVTSITNETKKNVTCEGRER